jgi:hypothetical protein
MDDVKHDSPGKDAWEPWTPSEVAAILNGCGAPWCVVGGWAIDLFLGRKSREHADIEIAVPRAFFPDVRKHLREYALFAVGNNDVRKLDRAEFPFDKHQCWVLDEGAQKWRVDVMLEPGDQNRWVYRRNPKITGSRSDFILRDITGIPFLAPQAVLLFKAAGRQKDNADFENVLPRLSADARAWLRIALATHPTSSWVEKLQ